MNLDTMLETLRAGSSHLTLQRPCTLGDGITALDEVPEPPSGTAERVSAFVPASGAATRMFAEPVEDTRLPFDGTSRVLAALPKGLVPFHRYPDGSTRTAFAEHLVEARALGATRVHFTVSATHRSAFAAAAAESHVPVELSEQDPATDTPCIRADGEPVRGDDGTLFRRPGGHGALLSNLEATGGDLVLIKNIDNIVPDWHRPIVLTWRRRLLNHLVALQGRAHDALRSDDGHAAAALCREVFGTALSEADALRQLDRPWRVAGMVRNEGEPGGGPFWVDGAVQIVEGVQISDEASQQAIRARATHFNPVDMAVGLRDHRGHPYRLADYIDPRACIVTQKQVLGAPATVLEHPGLWNGAMANWNTVFVEIPITTFNPVKRIHDLLRTRHQPRHGHDI